jgi:hypothetical protein
MAPEWKSIKMRRVVLDIRLASSFAPSVDGGRIEVMLINQIDD